MSSSLRSRHLSRMLSTSLFLLKNFRLSTHWQLHSIQCIGLGFSLKKTGFLKVLTRVHHTRLYGLNKDVRGSHFFLHQFCLIIFHSPLPLTEKEGTKQDPYKTSSLSSSLVLHSDTFWPNLHDVYEQTTRICPPQSVTTGSNMVLLIFWALNTFWTTLYKHKNGQRLKMLTKVKLCCTKINKYAKKPWGIFQMYRNRKGNSI